MKADLRWTALLAATMSSATVAVPGAALAEPRLEAPKLQLRHHRRAALPSRRALAPGRFELEGILERGQDGALVLALPIRPATRAQIARARGVPLAAVPKAVRRTLQVAPGTLGEASVDLRIGRRVRAVLARDRAGTTFVTELLSPRR